MKKIKILSWAVLAISTLSCDKKDTKADGYGNFEATEVTVSAEATGKIVSFALNEGDFIAANKPIGLIDTIQLYYSQQQLEATKNAVFLKSKNVLSQVTILQEQRKTIQTEKTRIQNLLDANAATQQQLDAINGQANVIQEQIKSIQTQNAPILAEANAIGIQIDKIADQIQKSKIINPIDGTVLAKYAEPNEITTFGKPLYKIANTNQMILRVYVSANQLSQIKIGQAVTVKVDVENGLKSYPATVSWISSVAEFTPKIIQTKEERVSLVYGVKVLVQNDGYLKIGMPAEMWRHKSKL
ncbi:HlyD family secretion protein [Flavobacterium crassostreae]|uniref:ABC transporter n=1 Tax=Flavobacterium crassostreae TaxID=1763534 RepID=A0A1B9E9F6_9FLAO|nr:HlyD family efflux transporter periplasmic adaptor subunit [Flavobacterium crassostreae]OCB78541.1 ABC transporter [Flavobacterium crassostreae]